MSKSSINKPSATKVLFAEQIDAQTASQEFISVQELAERFQEKPDALLQAMGGSRVEVAIGINSSMFQLEVTPQTEEGALLAKWVQTDTTARRPKSSTAREYVLKEVPLTFDAAITSLCQYFHLSKEFVVKSGVNLLEFWESSEAQQRLELPMSTDWKRYQIASAE